MFSSRVLGFCFKCFSPQRTRALLAHVARVRNVRNRLTVSSTLEPVSAGARVQRLGSGASRDVLALYVALEGTGENNDLRRTYEDYILG